MRASESHAVFSLQFLLNLFQLPCTQPHQPHIVLLPPSHLTPTPTQTCSPKILLCSLCHGRLWWQRIPLRARHACTRLTIASCHDKTYWYAAIQMPIPGCTGMMSLALAMTRRQLLMWPIQHTQRASRRAVVPTHLTTKAITTMSAKILPTANRQRP